MKKNGVRQLVLCCLILCFHGALTFAQNAYAPGIYLSPLLESDPASAPEVVSKAAVLIDAETGTLLYSKNPGEEISPASLTKLMTMHLVMREVNAGRASLDEVVPIGTESWAQSQPPRSSLMFLAPGQTVTLGEIMLGLAVSSGNDAAVAAALRVAPTVADFAEMMTQEARRMGLVKTVFTEPSGISENNMTTAAEFASFCREYVRRYPRNIVDFHSVPEFAYPKAANVAEAFRDNPRTIVQPNRNSLLYTFPGVDGLKTGYIDEAGYNIALTAERNGTRFIAVILGAPASYGGDRIRDRDGTRLLTWAFEHFRTVRPAIERLEPARLWKGTTKWAALRLAEAPYFTAPLDRAVGDTSSLRFTVETTDSLAAPLPAGYPAGWLIISDEQGELNRVRLITAQAYEQGNIFRRAWDSIRLLFMKKR